MRKCFFNVAAAFVAVLFLGSCNFIDSFSESEDMLSLSLSSANAFVPQGGMDIISLNVSSGQNSARVSWQYDRNIISATVDNYSAIITGLKPGTTSLVARCGSASATCLVTVTEDKHIITVLNPYVYALQDYVEVRPGQTRRIEAGLFGGTPNDMNGFTFSIADPDIAGIRYEGNYCYIDGIRDGFTRVEVGHVKVGYKFSVLVNCTSDGTQMTYITTPDNIITVNLSQQRTVSVDFELKNPKSNEYESLFEYAVADIDGREISSGPFYVSFSGAGSCTLSCASVGEAYLRVKHPQSQFPLDVLVRVTDSSSTAYIEPSATIVNLSGGQSETVTVNLKNHSGYVDPAAFEWDFSAGASDVLDWQVFNGNGRNTGDRIVFSARRNGSVKATVSYGGVGFRNIIILVRDVSSEAANATTFLTTSDNFVRLRPDGEESRVVVTLTNCSKNDINNIKWNIVSTAADGSSADVVTWTTGIGSSSSSSSLRSASARSASSSSAVAYSESAYAVLRSNKKGVAFISVTHPKSIYPLQIMVVVADDVVEKEPSPYLYLAGSPVLEILNGSESNALLSVQVQGNASPDSIRWSCDGGTLNLIPSGDSCQVIPPAKGSGGKRHRITAVLGGSTVEFVVLTYDNILELKELRTPVIYSTQPYISLIEGQSADLAVMGEYVTDFSQSRWSVSDGGSCVTIKAADSRQSCRVTAVSAGVARVTVSYPNADSFTFTVEVLPVGGGSGDAYISSATNVLYFDLPGLSQDMTVIGYNIPQSAYGDYVWRCSDPDSFEVSPNGGTATVRALRDRSDATLRITHPLSLNELTVNLRCGNKYVYNNPDVAYISTDKEVIEMYEGQDAVSLYASLVHTESNTAPVTKGFSFRSSDSDTVEVSGSYLSNYCQVVPKRSGTAMITVSHPDAAFDREVVVIIRNAPDSSSISYITTEQNIVVVPQGEYATVAASLVNASGSVSNKWHWSSLDDRTASVVAASGPSAMISANSTGTVQLKVSYDDCIYSLNIIVIVIAPLSASSNPYIKVSDNIITLGRNESAQISAEVVGGNDGDSGYFSFRSLNSSVALVIDGAGVATVRGMSAGMTQVRVTNSKYTGKYAEKTVLVIVEDTVQAGVHIELSQSIVKIKPDSSIHTNVKATLVNGTATDGQDFIWWADDYNLLSIVPVADSCGIIPTGRPGTTRVHVKHAKSSRQADILVLISNYDTFAFSKKSAAINTGRLYFFPLEVPSTENEYSVRYRSSNEDTCIIQGSGSVAVVCGLDYGTATLTAEMLSSDGTVLASSEMLVTVSVPDSFLPEISLGNTVITVEEGTARTFQASISGAGVESSEKFNLRWQVQNKDKGISLLNDNPDKVAYGPDCYLKFEYAGEYVVTVTHERTGASADLYIIVQEKGELALELSSSYEMVSVDEGSFSLTATVINGTAQDERNISWSAVRVGGNQVVSVTKTKGKTCTVSPRKTGQTEVIARLPNGKYAKCIVVVTGAADITFDLDSVHVIPGYTERVGYVTTPEQANIIDYATMESTSLTDSVKYFSYEFNKARKEVLITGLADCPGGLAGTIYASANGSPSKQLKVFVEYDVELSLLDTSGNRLSVLNNINPDTVNTRQFRIKYHPVDLNIELAYEGTTIARFPYRQAAVTDVCPDNLVSIGVVKDEYVIENGTEKCVKTVTLVPHNEGEGEFEVKALLPTDKSGKYAKTQTFYYNAYYDRYTPVIDMKMTAAGAFTRFENGTLYLNDGEEAIFSVSLLEENSRGRITGVTWSSDAQVVELSGDGSVSYKENATRTELAREIFGVSDAQGTNTRLRSIGNGRGSVQPSKSLISLKKSELDSGALVYRLKHNWDYYVDLPIINGNDTSTETGWMNYLDSINRSTSVFDTLINNGLTWMQVSYEPVFNLVRWVGNSVQNTKYYFINHAGTPAAQVNWSKGSDTRDNGNPFFGQKWGLYLEWAYATLAATGTIILYVDTTKQGYYSSDYINYDSNAGCLRKVVPSSMVFERVIPYAITTRELSMYPLFKTPYSSLDFRRRSKKGGTKSYKTYSTNCEYPSHANFYYANGQPFIIPVVSRDTTPSQIGTGSVQVTYRDARGVEQRNAARIPVVVERRMCEAYTSKDWNATTVYGYQRYVMSDSLFDKNNIVRPVPGFSVMAPMIDTPFSVKDMTLPYRVSPVASKVRVAIPDTQAGLRVKSNAVKVGLQDGKTVYEISSHATSVNGEAFGFIELDCDGPVETLIDVWSPSFSEVVYEVPVSVKTVDSFVPVITSTYATAQPSTRARYSQVEPGGLERVLFIGDGETVEFSVANKDTSSSVKVQSVTYLDYDSMDGKLFTDNGRTVTDENGQPVRYDFTWYDKTRDGTGTDARTQGQLVKFEDIGGGKYRLSHSRDYGYFVYGSGDVVDRFWNNETFTISNTVVTENDYMKVPVYPDDSPAVQEQKREQEAQHILRAKQYRLHVNKEAYKSDAAPRTSSVLPYWFADGELVESEKKIDATVVGELQIKYVKNGIDMEQDVFVAVQVRDASCAQDTGRYGLPVPSNYYESLTR